MVSPLLETTMLGWWRKRNDIHRLIAKGQYPRAIKLIEKQIRDEPKSLHLRKLLADVLYRAGDRENAADVLFGLADELAKDGFIAKAVAILKRIQRVDRRQSDVAERLTNQLVNLYGQEGASTSLRDPGPEELLPQEPPEEVAVTTSNVLLPELWQEAAGREDDAGFQWSPLFSQLSKEELGALISGLRLLVKEPGAIIVSQGEPGSSLFILANGMARAYTRDNSGHHRQAGIAREGALFGKASLLAGDSREYTYTAATRCELLELSRPTLEALAKDHPRIRTLVEEATESLESRHASPDEEL